MKKVYNTIIIGTGCAGYAAADRLFDLGQRDIAIVTEGRLMGTSRNTGSDKQTYYKLSLAGDEGDSVRDLAKTLYSGGGVMGEHALIEAAYSARCFMRLCDLGVPFPKNEYGEYAGYRTDHDTRLRATSAGPLTSKYMTEALERSVVSKSIEIIDCKRAIEILTEDSRVTGVAIADTVSGEISLIACNNVVLATGGPASIYEKTVYPKSQHGATSLAILAGARLSNMAEWQYGIASCGFKWNLSGSYQQVIPRYISVDAEGREREFLYDECGEESLGLIFLKGYEWPFDTRKLEGSSKIDLLVEREIRLGRRVYLDYTKNPCGLSGDLSSLPKEAYEYLKNSGALLETPILRLEKMNKGAIDLYFSHGIDLYTERLEIAVLAQHCNGGVLVDWNWESEISGLYTVGEAAGTFGVYRPGGSALNSTQVGALRVAEHIARKTPTGFAEPRFNMPKIKMGKSNIKELGAEYRSKMSRVGAFERSYLGMRELFDEAAAFADSFFSVAEISDKKETADLFRLYDTIITMRSVLSSMIVSAEKIGTHGAALVDTGLDMRYDKLNERCITQGGVSVIAPISEIPEPNLWFETLLAKKRGDCK